MERKLLVDFHGSFKPSGLQKKYPNVMTFEGVLGLEHDKDSRDINPVHDLILPFTKNGSRSDGLYSRCSKQCNSGRLLHQFHTSDQSRYTRPSGSFICSE
ncbi:glycoside hydrolase family 97 catalytic domain-containing protein [Bacteroides ovatus]|nr:glycoside hydrolase family 97 catalytic domain-containing protein [Bacteroides ovatus]